MRADDPVTRADQLQEHGDAHAAFHILLRAAQRADARVYLNLGYAYDVGRGVRRSKRKALRWYRRALEHGEAGAARNIGIVHRDRGAVVKALCWLECAVQLGDSGSNLLMGQILISRMGRSDEALTRFRAVSTEACEADVESAHVWAAAAEGMLSIAASRCDRTGRSSRAAAG